MMNMLVLGGNGFIGSHLVDHLTRNGHNVRVFDRNPERYRKPLNRVEYYLQDFGNRAALASALKNVDCEVVSDNCYSAKSFIPIAYRL